jgi:hypothetical protein
MNITIPFYKEYLTEYVPSKNPRHPLLYQRPVTCLGPAPTPKHPDSLIFLYAPHPIYQELQTDQDYDTFAYLQSLCKVFLQNDKTYIAIDLHRFHT